MSFELLPFDAKLAGYTWLELTGGRNGRGIGKIEFQFPPVIKSDSKMGSYIEKDIRNIEPLAIFAGAKAREVELKWTYIITGGTWTINKVANLVKGVRGYFYATLAEGMSRASNLIVRFRSGSVVGVPGQTWTFRAEGINVAYSDVMVSDGSAVGSNGVFSLGVAFPLRTDLTMKLKLWSRAERMSTDYGIKGVTVDETRLKEPMLDLPGLKSATQLTPDWY